MSAVKPSVKTFLEKLASKDEAFINNNDCYHFYDWFCSDKALVGKFKTLSAKVKKIAKSEKIKTESMYVWFKNNCPCKGPLYDDLRFSDITTGNVIYTIVPKSGRNGLSEVWGRENNFNAPIVEGTWNDIKKYFGV